MRSRTIETSFAAVTGFSITTSPPAASYSYPVRNTTRAWGRSSRRRRRSCGPDIPGIETKGDGPRNQAPEQLDTPGRGDVAAGVRHQLADDLGGPLPGVRRLGQQRNEIRRGAPGGQLEVWQEGHQQVVEVVRDSGRELPHCLEPLRGALAVVTLLSLRDVERGCSKRTSRVVDHRRLATHVGRARRGSAARPLPRAVRVAG